MYYASVFMNFCSCRYCYKTSISFLFAQLLLSHRSRFSGELWNPLCQWERLCSRAFNVLKDEQWLCCCLTPDFTVPIIIFDICNVYRDGPQALIKNTHSICFFICISVSNEAEVESLLPFEVIFFFLSALTPNQKPANISSVKRSG